MTDQLWLLRFRLSRSLENHVGKLVSKGTGFSKINIFVFFLPQSIINILKRHFNKHNYSAIQQVFPILKAFNAIQPDFYVTLQVGR